MKQLLFIFAAIILLTSCEKKYRYVETVRELSIAGGPSIKEKEEKIISAQTDSAAYIEAYREFCISQKAYSELRKKGMGESLGIPISFKLYNEKGEDISNIHFDTRLEQEEKLAERFMPKNNVAGNSYGSESMVDSAKIKDLLLYFNVEKDEFDPNGKTWYKPNLLQSIQTKMEYISISQHRKGEHAHYDLEYNIMLMIGCSSKRFSSRLMAKLLNISHQIQNMTMGTAEKYGNGLMRHYLEVTRN